MRSRGLGGLAAALAVALLVSASGHAQVFKSLTNEKLESILQGMNITFKKSAGNKEGVSNYDYKTNNFEIRLTNHNGKYLWIDALFNDRTTLEEMNKWNKQAKFSRAVLLHNKDKDTISLESQLDCQNGCTDGMIRQFITRFDGEVAAFVKFMSK